MYVAVGAQRERLRELAVAITEACDTGLAVRVEFDAEDNETQEAIRLSFDNDDMEGRDDLRNSVVIVDHDLCRKFR